MNLIKIHKSLISDEQILKKSIILLSQSTRFYVQYFLGFGISPFLAVPISSARLIMGPLHFRPNFALISIKKPCRGLWRKILNETKNSRKNEIVSPLARHFDKLSENLQQWFNNFPWSYQGNCFTKLCSFVWLRK